MPNCTLYVLPLRLRMTVNAIDGPKFSAREVYHPRSLAISPIVGPSRSDADIPRSRADGMSACGFPVPMAALLGLEHHDPVPE